MLLKAVLFNLPGSLMQTFFFFLVSLNTNAVVKILLKIAKVILLELYNFKLLKKKKERKLILKIHTV